MTPVFEIVANGQDITQLISDRLLSITVTDEAGIISDSLSINLDNRDYQIAPLDTGAEIEVKLGYKQTGLVSLGLFTVDEIQVTGPPHTMTVECKAADMRHSLKAHKARSWDNVTIDTLVRTIASEHGLTPAVSQSLASVLIAHVDQTDESDMHLLTRLSHQYGAVTKPVNGYLIFLTAGDATSAFGKPLPVVSIDATEVSSYRLTMADRLKYNKVLAHWHNSATGKKDPVTAGSGEPVYTLRGNYADIQSAQAAANAKLEALKRGASSGHVVCPVAKLEVMAESPLELTGFPAVLNASWVSVRVEYRFDSSGLSAVIDFETPKPPKA